ncbi:M28 family peptidase [Bacteroidales bacterium OttesenSCG-928-M11]|nr:M28 family peptidase [Bacteroidales bacterium OttesenSCG-928-M11]
MSTSLINSTYYLLLVVCCFLFSACSSKPNNSSPETKQEVKVPSFNADSAYYYTEKQVSFGPRVPNSESHKLGGDYLANELRRHGAQVFEQEIELYTYNNIKLEARNIIGSFSPNKGNRILLCAHWDTRPFADEDSDSKNHHTPIDGANDGAGACGVLLEIARNIALQETNIGIDIIFFDAEDWGTPTFERLGSSSTGWCLGSEYWAQNPHIPNYQARYGMLLDMVSAKDAKFYREHNSVYYAKHIVDKVWQTAANLGFSNYFINQLGGGIEDDHVYVNQHRHIPCIDIIQQDPNTKKGFGSYWHTLDDNMESISKETMYAVGQTVLHVIYHE